MYTVPTGAPATSCGIDILLETGATLQDRECCASECYTAVKSAAKLEHRGPKGDSLAYTTLMP